MTFLRPTVDIAFKKLFSNEQHKNILISFLNSILDRAEGKKIVDVVINDPHNLPDILEDKSSVVDVACTDQSGARYIIEMQVVKQEYFAQRAQYYAALGLSHQLQKRGLYRHLKPVIFVGILGFNISDDTSYIDHHYILSQNTGKRAFAHLEWHTVELKKFHKTLDELETDIDKWIYFLKNAQIHEDVPKSFQEVDEMKEAFGIIERMKWTEKEYTVYERDLDRVRVADSEQAAVLNDIERGVEKGLQQGRQEGRQEIALRLLKKNFDLQDIVEATELSIEVIEQLKKNSISE